MRSKGILVLLFGSSSAFAGTCPTAGTGWVNIGAEKFKAGDVSQMGVVGAEYSHPAACEAFAQGLLRADTIFGVDYASGSLHDQWAGITNYYGGFRVGYELPMGLEFAVGYAASAIDARYHLTTAHLGARQTSLVLQQRFDDHWSGRVEYRQGNYAPDGADQLTVRGVLVGLGYAR